MLSVVECFDVLNCIWPRYSLTHRNIQRQTAYLYLATSDHIRSRCSVANIQSVELSFTDLCKFDIRCLLNPKFNHYSVIWNHYESSVSSKLLAKRNVAVLETILARAVVYLILVRLMLP